MGDVDRRSPNPGGARSPGRVSVIVPAHGPVPFIGEALEPLLSQMAADDELLIVDNGIDPTVDCRAFTTDERVRVIPARDRAGAGYARNVGVANATHDLLVFADADDVAGEGYVDALRLGLADHAVVAVAESFHRLNSGTAAEQPDSDPIWYWHDDRRWPFVGSCAFAMTRQAFDTVGGFDTAIPALEDIELGCRLTLAGIAMYGIDGPVMHIRHRGTVAEEHRRQRTHGRASVWLEERYADQGFPRERLWRNAIGWVRHVIGLLSPSRDSHLAVLGWKWGRIQGAMDRRGGPQATDLDLAGTDGPASADRERSEVDQG